METTKNSNGITIRRLGHGDEAAIERLIELDSGRRPEGELMGVEIDGRLLVASSVETGESIADPFSRTAELRALLEVRIAQMNGKKGEHRSKRFGRRRTHSRGALAGSPPGAGGKLLTLPVRLG
ncbi:MAG: hypothetical protein QOI31_2855 [Solirubrobacterales bacterium]|jgi:hypothetical protein|nr:hypothetical protein [Solirubrobacterales bacterium]